MTVMNPLHSGGLCELMHHLPVVIPLPVGSLWSIPILSYSNFQVLIRGKLAVQMEVMLNNSTLLTCASVLASVQDVVAPTLAIETRVRGEQNTNDEHKVVDTAEEGGDGNDNDDNENGEFEDGEGEFSDEGVHGPNKSQGNAKKSNGDTNGEGDENGDEEDGGEEGHDDDNDDNDDDDDGEDNDDDGEEGEEEEEVVEEPEDDEEEDDKEETIQPPKKRKK
ncbi:hypothetical protein K7X08_023759 [Anisodus acutangulus]|uniref:Uncharacterized protein n=1 Tax=Anisodus acutangulus TaxID=402998 RepID=A0A9Q1QXU9_9SOLA|nr:hypothetical protein K7X08_023759 [Anisodus acutangulus]